MISTFNAGTVIAETVQASDDLTVYYEAAGSGDKTILFVPGWGMSSAVFEKQLEEFEGSNEYRAISYDPRGQGQSSKTEGGHFYDQRGADLHAFIEALKLNNITLVAATSRSNAPMVMSRVSMSDWGLAWEVVRSMSYIAEISSTTLSTGETGGAIYPSGYFGFATIPFLS